MPDPEEQRLEPKNVLLTLDRGLRVLEEIARFEGDATAKSISASVGVKLGTCYQLLRTLEQRGYVHKLPGSRFGLGNRVGFLIEYYDSHKEPPVEFLEILHDLHRDLEETVYVSLRRGKNIEIAAQLEGTGPIRVSTLSVGYGGYPHVRATTKAFLANSDDPTRRQFLGSDSLESLTPNTITDRDLLDAEFQTIRVRGYALDNEEFMIGIGCIGAVILDSAGEPIGAYGTSFPSSRLSTDRDTISANVMTAAERASRVAGYEGTYPPRSAAD